MRVFAGILDASFRSVGSDSLRTLTEETLPFWSASNAGAFWAALLDGLFVGAKMSEAGDFFAFG